MRMQRLECRSEQNVLETVFKNSVASVWAKICACWKYMHQVCLRPKSKVFQICWCALTLISNFGILFFPLVVHPVESYIDGWVKSSYCSMGSAISRGCSCIYFTVSVFVSACNHACPDSHARTIQISWVFPAKSYGKYCGLGHIQFASTRWFRLGPCGVQHIHVGIFVCIYSAFTQVMGQHQPKTCHYVQGCIRVNFGSVCLATRIVACRAIMELSLYSR